MLHLTLRQLRVFNAVASELSFSRAAGKLHLTQPAVSMQIKQLEENIGLPLFEQIGKKIYLTEPGREFQRYCNTILQQLQEAETMFADFKDMSGKLTICVASTASYFTPRLLADFCKRYPKAQVSLNVTNRETLLRRLENNEVDMTIMGRPPEDLDLEATPFMENPLVIIAPPDHPLAQARSIPLARLAQETFLVREQGSGTRIAMERFFAERGIRLTTGTEMSTNEAIKQAVQAGMGLGILSMHTVALELETARLVVLDVQGFPIQRYWYVVHRKGKRLSRVAQAFKDYLLGMVKHHALAESPRPQDELAY
ncbi:MAG: LysR family transcriptional regulator [Methylophilaceae bacterium]|nr:LysR family transcriptional regulator [Methylophilaceae bacterium]